MPVSANRPTSAKFVTDVFAIDVDGEGAPALSGCEIVDRAISKSLASGIPVIEQPTPEEDRSIALSVPIYRDGRIQSLAGWRCSAGEHSIGVMEIWQPTGEYDELSLTGGYYGGLDRFQNVSSFVRFEKGSGLPGQVWRNLSFVIHDDLSSHPGFLRAAGASAESLQVAFGIPVCSTRYLASTLLISSDSVPIAKGYEVWRYIETDRKFLLEAQAYQTPHDALRLAEGTTVAADGSFAGLVIETEGVAVSDDQAVLLAGRPATTDTDEQFRGMAIPFYEMDRLTNVLTLLL